MASALLRVLVCGLSFGLLTACGPKRVEPLPFGWDAAGDDAPMVLRASFYDARGGHYSMPAVRIRLIAPWRPEPVAITAPGCGFAVRDKDVPKGTVILSVDENPDHLRRASLMEACIAHDPRKVAAAVRSQLKFMTANLGLIEIADPNRAVIFATGEAAPVAATLSLPVRGRILVGDPCLVSWSSTPALAPAPTTWLRADPVGVQWASIYEGPARPAHSPAPARSRKMDGNVKLAPCRAQPRPDPAKGVDVRDYRGDVETYERPAGMIEAQRAAFARYVAQAR